MAELQIIKWPDARLSQPCASVGAEDLSALIADMFDTMYAANGRGLAAPQVAVMKRLFVMDCSWKEGAPDPVALINPVILSHSAETSALDEGCLSIPGVSVSVTRPTQITLHWQTPDGDGQTRDFDGFEARCIQHELDHLNGTVTFDHLSKADRRVIELRYSDLKENAQ